MLIGTDYILILDCMCTIVHIIIRCFTEQRKIVLANMPNGGGRSNIDLWTPDQICLCVRFVSALVESLISVGVLVTNFVSLVHRQFP